MKLFVTDYDGTLFVDEISIKDNIRMLLELQKRNYKVVINTGRSYPSIKNQLDMYSIPYDYIICADGSLLYDNIGNVMRMYEMDEEIIEPFKKFYQEIHYEEMQFVYKEGYSNILRSIKGLLGINICLSTINYTNNIVNDFIRMSKEYPRYNFLNYCHPKYSYLCIKPKGVSKSFSIEYLRKKYHILKKDVHVIGDASNDYEMIRDFDGVCISKSTPEILAIAKKHYKNIDYYINDLLQED